MQETITRLQLLKTSGIGKITFFHLLKIYGNAIKALDALPIYNQTRNKIDAHFYVYTFIYVMSQLSYYKSIYTTNEAPLIRRE